MELPIRSFPLIHIAEHGQCDHCKKHSPAYVVFSVPTALFTSIAFETLSTTRWIPCILRGDPVLQIYLAPSCAREFFRQYISTQLKISLSVYDTYHRPRIRQCIKALMRIRYFQSSHCPDSTTVFDAVRRATQKKRVSTVQKLFRGLVDTPNVLGIIADVLTAPNAERFHAAYTARIDQHIQGLQHHTRSLTLRV